MSEKKLIQEALKKPILVLGSSLDFSSYQATFHEIPIMPGSLAKIFGHELIPFIDLHLEDEGVRSDIIRRESTMTNKLSKRGYPVEIRAVSFSGMPHDTLDTALVKPILEKDDFLNERLKAGKVTQSTLYDVVKRCIDLHFDEEIVKPAKVLDYPVFLAALMTQEARLLKVNYPDEAAQIDSWDKIVQEFIRINSDLIKRRQKLLGEPKEAHGDLETINIAVDRSGNLIIDDPAPKPEWFINDRFMDIFFLVEDLRTDGYVDEADFVRRSYELLYLENIEQRGMVGSDFDEVLAGNDFFMLFSEVYRRTNFLRLAHPNLRKQPERQERSYTLLQQAYEEVKATFGK